MKIVAVTSCATGIAHTYMAAEAIERAGKAAGHEMIVETQGAGGYKPIAREIIQTCDVVMIFDMGAQVNPIVAMDKNLDLSDKVKIGRAHV